MAGEDEFPMPVLERLLVACLDDQDVRGVAAVIGAMAMRDPKRAEQLRQWLLLGCDLARAVVTADDPRAAASIASDRLVLDLFAGPGGWDEGVRPLGLRPVGIEWDEAACRTAMAAGHTRVRADVEQLPTEPMVGKVWGLIASPPCQDFSLAGLQKGIGGEKGKLITQVLRWTEALMPRWVVCEQVPPCIDFWHEYAEIMRGWGYKAWAGVVNAADYGVPQTRKRAILIASLDRHVTRPRTTHAQGGDVDLFDERQPWISMADALGWDSPLAYRRSRGPGMTERYGERRDHPIDEPAPTLTGKARSDEWVYVNGTMAHAARRPASEPAPTVMFGHRSNDVRWVLSTGNNSATVGPDQRTGDWRAESKPYERSIDEPAPTVDTKAGGAWQMHEEGHRGDVESHRVTIEEAAILQSFPADYPWRGSRTKKYEQVGNAVPPRLALHVVAEALGVQVAHATEEGAAA